MRLTVFSCDICHAQRKEANHWFLLFTDGNAVRLERWDLNLAYKPDATHLCGENCVNRMIMQLIGGTPKREEASGVCV